MNFADLLLSCLLIAALFSGLYLLRIFLVTWKPEHYHQSRIIPLTLPWTDFILFGTGFVLCYWQAQSFVILYSLAFIISVLILRGQAPLLLWNLQPGQIPSYAKTGLKTYLTMFLPFSLLTAACATVFSRLGFKDINQPAVEMFMRSEGFQTIAGFLFFACVIAPIWEEITFRGFLYPFLKAKTGKTAALILSSLLFAALHQHLPSFIPLSFLGALLALLYERTGSLGYSILLHSFFNLSTCLVLLLLKFGSNPDLWKTM